MASSSPIDPQAAAEEPTVPAPLPRKSEWSAAPVYGHYATEKRADGSPWILGQGGMGITFKAVDVNLQCPVALKIISPEYLGGEQSKRRFVREAQLAAQIRHPNVAAIHHLDCQDGQFFYAMEFVDGITAGAWVRQRGPMSVELALDVVMQVARALTAADQFKVLHRDIKPANIMILPDPANPARVIAKLIDFGLARSAAQDGMSDATTCGFSGTPQYASPEQAENLPIDVRSDIYSLGCTLWYLLLGEAPYTGSPARVLAQLLTADPPWVKIAHLPRHVIHLLRTMLARNVNSRPESPVALHAQITACRDQLATAAAVPNHPVQKSSPLLGAVRAHLYPLAFAGALGLVLIFLALPPHSNGNRRELPTPSLAEIPGVALIPAPTEPAPVQSNRTLSSSFDGAGPDLLAPRRLEEAGFGDFANLLGQFEPGDGLFAVAHHGFDSTLAAADLNYPSAISFTLRGMETASSATPNPFNSPNQVAEQPNGDRQHGTDRRRGSRPQRQFFSPIDRIRGGVSSLVRRIF